MFSNNSSGSDMDTAPVKKVAPTKSTQSKKKPIVADSSEGEDAAAQVMTVDDSDSDVGSKKPDKDEFDISDSDDGGFARKVASHVKKPAPKKLAKKQDLFSGMMAGGGEQSKKVAVKKSAAKKLPAPKKTAPTKKKKLSSGSEDDKPAKKTKPATKKAMVESDSGSDFNDAPPPPPREKAGGNTDFARNNMQLTPIFLGRSRAPVSYQGLDETDSDF